MKKMTSTLFPFKLTQKRSSTFTKIVGAAVVAVSLFVGQAGQGQTSDFKWNQPPQVGDLGNIFLGWNETSVTNYPPIAADDWVCTTASPVTKIRWWGSFQHWMSNSPPPFLPNAFQITIWTDFPTNMTNPFSHPSNAVWQTHCQNFTWQFVGWDYDPRTTNYEACFLFEQTLTPSEYFYQNPGPTGTNIYWISIAAEYGQQTLEWPWGWKTRPRDPTSPAPDAAVRIYAPPPWLIGVGTQYEAGEPILWPYKTNSLDLAFELISAQTIQGAKWWQVPDLSMNGMDVKADANQPPRLLADDFRCTSQEPITNITIWGSWTNDYDWHQGLTFVLSIHDDIPSNSIPPYYSIPGTLRWTNQFLPGQYTYSMYSNNISEWWFTPTNFWYFPGDHMCWQYDFNIPPGMAFWQEGTIQSNKVYWLDVQAFIQGATDPRISFGWKTCPTNWNDDAVWANGTEQSHGPWSALKYPPPHERHGQTVDMAFRLNAGERVSYEVKWSQPPQSYHPTNSYYGWNDISWYGGEFGYPIVADDWVCTNSNPVTDIHWWGSFSNWTETVPPKLPDEFRITFWTDKPKSGTGGPQDFSHPSNCVGMVTCTNFSYEFAGWDWDPRNPNAAPEACFLFQRMLATNEWFHQDPAHGTNIYWISIAAFYTNPQMGQTCPWGWKTRPRDTNSLAPDDAVRIYNPTAPLPDMLYVSGEPIWWPYWSNSWDMAFELTTIKGVTPTNDFGDAPSPYPTLLANNGARHTRVPGVFLGGTIDAELNGQPDPNALGDDNNPPAGLDDEDGVWLTSLPIPGVTAGVQVTASVNGFLSAWLDFDADGSWATPGDQIFTNVALNAGVNNLAFNVPLTAASGSNTFARFRFSTVTNLTYTGQAPNGEVEDYQWHIAELDFGDAPDPPFPTLRASNGARHVIFGGVFMGARVDAEQDGQPDPNALGDDNNPPAGPDDEDGVILLTQLVPGQPATVQVTASIQNGILNAWIDFGADGSWAQPSDQIANNLPLGFGLNIVGFIVPGNAAGGSNVFARFRFSTMANLSYTNTPGMVPIGEVEDYKWQIEKLDFGDAPDPNYPTLFANNGARHLITNNFCLGTLEDAETDGLAHPQALGDDNSGVDDEDGITFVTPLIVGTQACVNVTLTGGGGGGRLDAWVDFNANGTWESGEKVFASQLLVPGLNTNCFQVPTNALIGPTFARFRLSSAGGLLPTGYAADGEVEDYLVTLVQRRPTNSISITNCSLGNMFNGWNEPSVYGSTNIAADDWVCTTTNPVTDIRWWGSFLDWRSNTPPTLPSAFHITIWTDVPGQLGGFSHPGQVLWETDCTNFTWAFVGWDFDPRTHDYEACFQFDQKLATNRWFCQTNGPTGTNIYWLSVAAVYQQGPQPQNVWGWKTLPRATNSLAPDDAVRIFSPTAPHSNNVFVSGEPIWWPYPTNSWDLAFELGSSYTNVLYKWEQPPDLSAAGIDVNDTAYTYQPPPPYLLADDFLCTSTGPLTDISIWGSWTNDWVPDPSMVSFTLSIHSDIPDPDDPGPQFSMPGQLLWQKTFGPPQQPAEIIPVMREGWLNPPSDYNSLGDTICFRYDFHVGSNAFVQTNGTIYWLDVQAVLATPMPVPKFGWKTSIAHWNDDAVWAFGTEQGHGAWSELRYPPGHPYVGQSIDLAFRLANSQSVYQLKWSQPPVPRRYVKVEWTPETGIQYQLQATAILTNNLPGFWSNVGPVVIGPVNIQMDTNAGAARRFYRIVAPDCAP